MATIKQEIESQDINDNNESVVETSNNEESNEQYDADDNDCDNTGKTNLIVNYLPQNMTDEDFEALFKKFGPMKSCKIVRNRSSGYSYGFGFVDFETHEQALKAIEELNGYDLEQKKIKVAFARPAGKDIKQANLYIKNVPNEWSQDDIRNVFESYGNIIQVRVLGNDRGVAFVLYDLRKQAEDALQALNGTIPEGCEKPLEIKFAADKKSEKVSNKNPSGTGNGTGNGRNRNERGSRGGRNQNSNNRNRRDNSRERGRQRKSFFDGQNNRRGNNQYNPPAYGGGNQYVKPNINNVGPVRQSNNRMNRYSPFITVQQPMAAMPIAPTTNMLTQQVQIPQNPMVAPIMQVGGPGYSYVTPQQQMMACGMLPGPQMTTLQPNGQIQATQQNPLNIYANQQMPMTFAPMAPAAMNNMYSVASTAMNNAANLQPQLGQQMNTRIPNNNNNNNNNNIISNNNHYDHHSRNSSDDGVTLFVYNIGPESDEMELRSLFGPYGHVVKCNVVRKNPGGESKGFGFVTMKDREQANAAISGLNGSMRNGRALQVSFKK